MLLYFSRYNNTYSYIFVIMTLNFSNFTKMYNPSSHHFRDKDLIEKYMYKSMVAKIAGAYKAATVT